MEDKWFFYLTLFLVFFVITSSSGLYTEVLFAHSSPGPFNQVTGTSADSSQVGFREISSKMKVH